MVAADEIATYAGAVAAILVAGAGGLFRLMQSAVNKKLVELKAELIERITTAIESTVREFAETVGAIRAKVTEMELWNRDNFVSQRVFDSIVTDMRDTWRRLEDKIDRRFDALERKLSKMDGGE